MFEELRNFADHVLPDGKIDITRAHLDALFSYQKARCKHWNSDAGVEIECPIDIHAFVDSCRRGSGDPLIDERPTRYRILTEPLFDGDKMKFSRDVVWFGRKGGAYLYDVETIAV